MRPTGAVRSLTAQDVLDKLGTIVMIDVRIPTDDGRILEMRRYSQPELEHRILLAKLKLNPTFAVGWPNRDFKNTFPA